MDRHRLRSITRHSSLLSRRSTDVDLDERQEEAAGRIMEDAHQEMEKQESDALERWSLHAHQVVCKPREIFIKNVDLEDLL